MLNQQRANVILRTLEAKAKKKQECKHESALMEHFKLEAH